MMRPASLLPLLGILAVGLLGTGCAVSQTTTQAGAPLARQITQSAHCGLVAPGNLHFKSRADVDRLAGVPGATLALAPLREIDFGREHLVLVALGRKPTGGYSVTLSGSRIVGKQLELAMDVREPAPGAMVSQALTTPCAVVAVTATGWDVIRVTRPEINR